MKIAFTKLSERFGKGKIDPVYILTGEQELLRELAVEQLQVAVLGDARHPGFNLDRFDGTESSVEDVLMSVNMLPMMGGRRLVLVRRALGFVEETRGRGGAKKAEAIEALESYLEAPASHTVLVLDLEKKPDARRKAWKAIEKISVVVQCDAPRERDLDDWIGEQARERKLRLGRDEIRYLKGEFGADLRRLTNELEKLSLYAAGERLDMETLPELLGRGKAQSIFKFTDAIAAGDTSSALEQLGRLIEEGEPPLRILALVDRLVGQLRVAREIGRGRGQELAQALGVPPFVARNLGDQASRRDAAQLDRALRYLSETDRALKSSAIPARLALEKLVVTLCRSGSGSGSGARSRSAVSSW